MFFSWLPSSQDQTPLNSRRKPTRPPTRRNALLALEVLEDRRLPSSVFTVKNNNDSGTGSLRKAINNANGTPGSTIQFSIGSGSQTIALSTALPTITASGTIID